MTDAEEILLQNYKAHLQSVLSNIDDASKNLVSLNASIGEAQNTFATLQSLVAGEQEELERLSKESREVSLRSAERVALADSKERQLFELQAETDRKVADALSVISRSEETIASLNKEIALLTESCAKEERELQNILNKKATQEAEVLALADRIAEMTRQLDTLEKRREAAHAAHKHQKELFSNELATIAKTIEIERARLGETERNIAAREQMVDGREKSIVVVQERINELYARYFPDVTPPRL